MVLDAGKIEKNENFQEPEKNAKFVRKIAKCVIFKS